MKQETGLPKRKKNCLENYDYSSSGAYFITVCTKDRKALFWDEQQMDCVGEDSILPPDDMRLSAYGKIVDEAIQNIPQNYPGVALWQYVIMPNHVHMILVVPTDNGRIISSPTSVLTVIGQMKRYASKKIGENIWQRSFHDHIIRNGKDYEKIAKYIAENPAKWKEDCFYAEAVRKIFAE